MQNNKNMPQDRFSIDHLNETEFEEFCFDLIKELGFKNVDWRKGTGFSTSPSDQGRDIEAKKFANDIDGEMIDEKWFFECKHYKEGVPPEKLQGAIAWASAERPDKLVIIASNFLSNPCKRWLEDYQINSKPTFKIKIWELKELETLAYDKINLKNKYSINSDIALLNLIHPAHIKYSVKPSFNSLDYFFKLMDKLNPTIREEILSPVMELFILPRYRAPLHSMETIRELRIDPVDYNSFKAKCYELKNQIHEMVLVKSIVNSCLEWAFHYGDKSSIHEIVVRNQYILEHIKTNPNGFSSERIEKMISDTENRIKEIPQRTVEAYERYKLFCDEILSKLMIEEILL